MRGLKMAEVWWIKLATGMFDDDKIRLIEALPEGDSLLIIWIKLLCQAGKVNANGYIFLTRDIPFTDDNLATLFNRPITTIRLALATFQQLSMIEITEKGMIYLPNWGKYQSLKGMDDIREQTRLRVERFRLLKKGDSSVTSNVSVTDDVTPGNTNVTDKSKSKSKSKSKNIELDIELDSRLKIISNIYTVWNEQKIIVHKKLTDKTQSAINKALRDNTEEEIIQAIRNYSEIQKGEQYYFKYAWGLREFLERGLPKFLDLEIAKSNYLKDKNNNGAHQQSNNSNKRGKVITDPSQFTRPEDY